MKFKLKKASGCFINGEYETAVTIVTINSIDELKNLSELYQRSLIVSFGESKSFNELSGDITIYDDYIE